MEPVLNKFDDHAPEVIAYWAKHGMVKEFHGESTPMDWELYEKKTGYRWVEPAEGAIHPHQRTGNAQRQPAGRG